MWFLHYWIVLPDFRISYLDIFKVVELTCAKHQAELVVSPSLEEIIHYDLWARKYAANLHESSRASPVPAWGKLALAKNYQLGVGKVLNSWQKLAFLPRIILAVFEKKKKRRERRGEGEEGSNCIINWFGGTEQMY